MPKISVIVPVYNGENYIKRCFESIKNQTFKDLEIIFINDGSNDSSKDILEEIKNNNSNVKVYNQSNSGPGVARNKGIDLSNGDFLTFLDVDDVIDENMYKSMYSYVNLYDVDLVVCGQEIRYINSKDNIEMLPKYSKDVYLNKDEIREYVIKPILRNGPELLASQCNKLYKKSIIDRYNIKVNTERLFGEDWFFNQLFIGKINKIAFVKEPLYKYIRSNNESLSSVYLKNAFELFRESRVFRKKRMYEWKLDSFEDFKVYNTYYCKDVYDRVILNEISRDNYQKIKSKYENIKKYLNDSETLEALSNCYEDGYTKILSKKPIRVFLKAYFDLYLQEFKFMVKKIIRR